MKDLRLSFARFCQFFFPRSTVRHFRGWAQKKNAKGISHAFFRLWRSANWRFCLVFCRITCTVFNADVTLFVSRVNRLYEQYVHVIKSLYDRDISQVFFLFLPLSLSVINASWLYFKLDFDEEKDTRVVFHEQSICQPANKNY